MTEDERVVAIAELCVRIEYLRFRMERITDKIRDMRA